MMRIVFLLLTISVYSQKKFKSIDNFTHDYNEKTFEIWVKDSIYKFDLNKNFIEKYFNPLFMSIDIRSIQTIHGHKNELFVSNGSGKIFNKKEGRIDSSNINSFFTNSISLEHNDTIFKIGGYGFWTKFKGIVFYDRYQKTWESYQLSNVDKNYLGLLSPKISKIDDNKFLIYGGKTFDEKNPLIEKPNHEIYLLDMSKKEIVKHGDFKFSLQGKKVESQDIIINKNEITVIDWKKNKLFKYNSSWSQKVDLEYNIYLLNNKFYFIEKRENSYILSSSPDEIKNLKVSNSIDIISDETEQIIYVVLIFLFLFGLIFIYKKHNTISIGKDKLRYRFKSISITIKHHQILCEIIKNNNITTNQIHKVLNTKDLHPNHIYRLIPEIMSDIEKSIKILTNSDQPVFSISKNKMDRRIKEYRLNPHYRIKN